MAGPVTFDFTTWTTLYPEFASVSPVLAQSYFNRATLYCRNDGRHPASTDAILSELLYMLTSHIAKMSAPAGGQAPTLTGRVSSVSEGSVSISTELPMQANAAWFQQTTYGFNYWTATAQYRTMHYVPGIRRVFFPG